MKDKIDCDAFQMIFKKHLWDKRVLTGSVTENSENYP